MLNIITDKSQAETVLTKKAVIVSLSISQWSARRFDRKLTEDVHRSHKMSDDAGRYNKLLVRKDALEEVAQIAGRGRTLHVEKTLPWMDQEGQRLLPSAEFMAYMNEERELKRKFEDAVKRFEKRYPEYVEDAKRRLNGQFNPDDYPHPKMIGSRFSWNVTVLPVPVADFRCDLSSDDKADIEAEVQDRLTKALQQTQRDALQRAAAVIEPMIEKLRNYKPAEKRGDRTEGAFRDSLVENVRDFIPMFRSFNFTNDPKIEEIAFNMERSLAWLDPEDLRERKIARTAVANAAEKILKDVSELMA